MLAAGRSQRLSMLTEGRSKALVQIGGVSLVERAVRTLERAGCDRVVVVVGHQGDEVGRAARLAGGNVEVVHAPNWEDGNGASLAAAEDAVGGEPAFVVMCGDHTFSADALDPLLDAGGPAVLIDDGPSPEAWGEGMKVHVERGHATAFAKTLDERAIDCGVFVLPPAVFDAAIIAGLWLWSWDDPSRTFRIEIILAAMIGWAILSQILYGPFDVISRFDDELPPATALLGARDSRLVLIAGVSLFDQPVPAFLVAAFAYLSSGLHRILLVGRRGRGDADAGAPTGLSPPDQVRETA